MRFITIGVYGWSESRFFGALVNAGVDLFCDIRWRRGVRGSEYAFVNSTRLQKRLSEIGISYLHRRDLAPSPALRKLQLQKDKEDRVAKRQRTILGEVFTASYIQECLSHFDAREFVQDLGPAAGTVALFCVEREPAACHRSLLASRLEQDLAIPVTHLVPNQSDP